jgi:hypothetical protein
MEFQKFPKVPRLSRTVVVTEKIDGTNASVWVDEITAENDPDKVMSVVAEVGGLFLRAGSRNGFVYPEGFGPKGCDNFGFASWVRDNAEELAQLGPGVHYGEWWGAGIQRRYGLDHKRFSLFNTGRWYRHGADVIGAEDRQPAPACCHVVPVLWQGPFDLFGSDTRRWLDWLEFNGSQAAPGFKKPEGIMVYHTAARQYFKKTFENDETGKE